MRKKLEGSEYWEFVPLQTKEEEEAAKKAYLEKLAETDKAWQIFDAWFESMHQNLIFREVTEDENKIVSNADALFAIKRAKNSVQGFMPKVTSNGYEIRVDHDWWLILAQK